MFKNSKQITAADLRNHHINLHPYASDLEYVKVAKELERRITSLAGGVYINKEVAKDLAISLTLHLEDTVADAGVWRGFCMGHKCLYGKYLPFQWSEWEGPLDEVTPQSCAFIIWMTLTKYEILRFSSPMMPAVDALGKAVFEYLDGVFYDMPINEEMLDDVYSEDVLGDFYKMRNVLSWLSDPEGCYMSFSEITVDGYAQGIDFYSRYISEEKQVGYQIHSTMPFKEMVGPLALLPQEWYADMMGDHDDVGVRSYAERIREIKFKPYNMYKVESIDDAFVTLQGLDKEVFKVCFDDFGFDRKEVNQDDNLVIGAFAYYNGSWHVTGSSSFQKYKSDFDVEIKKYVDAIENNKREISIYQKFIDKNHGRRLYYFHSFEEMKVWHDQIAKAKDRNKLFDNFPDHIKKAKELLVYLPTDGGMELAEGLCAPICDVNNPFYDEETSMSESMGIIATDALRGECMRYIIGQGGLKNLSFAGPSQIECHNMAQANLDFLARYYRRSMY